MNRQISLSMLSDELSQAKTKKKEFLEQMDRVIPWDEWMKIIKPFYYKGERGNKPYELELMLRIHMLQNLYDLSDMGVMTEVIFPILSKHSARVRHERLMVSFLGTPEICDLSVICRPSHPFGFVWQHVLHIH